EPGPVGACLVGEQVLEVVDAEPGGHQPGGGQGAGVVERRGHDEQDREEREGQRQQREGMPPPDAATLLSAPRGCRGCLTRLTGARVDGGEVLAGGGAACGHLSSRPRVPWWSGIPAS